MYELGKLGFIIKKARQDKKFSQEMLSEMIDITPTHLKHIESGHRKPSVEVLFSLFNALDISFEELRDKSSDNCYFERVKLNYMIDQCNEKQLFLITEIVKLIKENCQ